MYQRSMAESDCVVVMGSNMAENHPVAFRWPMVAKANGAKLIHVDPRFTRTSAVADLYAPIRAGSDLAFLGGLVVTVVSVVLTLLLAKLTNFVPEGGICIDGETFGVHIPYKVDLEWCCSGPTDWRDLISWTDDVRPGHASE